MCFEQNGMSIEFHVARWEETALFREKLHRIACKLIYGSTNELQLGIVAAPRQTNRPTRRSSSSLSNESAGFSPTPSPPPFVRHPCTSLLVAVSDECEMMHTR